MYTLGGESITVTKGGVTSTIDVDSPTLPSGPTTMPWPGPTTSSGSTSGPSLRSWPGPTGRTTSGSTSGATLRPWPGPTSSTDDAGIVQITPVGPTSVGSTLRGVGFHTQANPVQAFIRALQQALGVSATGVWNPATHSALQTFVRPVNIGEWGQDPSKVARNATALVSPSAEAEFQRNKRFLGLLGYPTSSRATFDAAVRPDFGTILTVLDNVQTTIRAAESVPMRGSTGVGPSPASSAEGFFAKNKVLLGIGAGVLVLSGITIWLVRRKR